MTISQDELVAILAVLLGVSELVALSPKYKSNSVLQLVISSIKRVLGKKKEEPKEKIEEIAKDLIIDEAIKEITKELEDLK